MMAGLRDSVMEMACPLALWPNHRSIFKPTLPAKSPVIVPNYTFLRKPASPTVDNPKGLKHHHRMSDLIQRTLRLNLW